MDTISFLRMPDVVARTGLSRSSIYAKVKSGEFPTSIPIGARSVAWRSDHIDQWIQKCIDDSDQGDK